MQGIFPFTAKTVPDNDEVTGRAGLVLVIEAMRAFGLDALIKSKLKVSQRSGGFSETEKVEAFMCLLASGGDCVADINVLRADAGLCRLLGRELPSADALFDFLYACHDTRLIEKAQQARKPDQIAYIPEENGPLKALGQVLAEFTRRVASQGKGRKATLDHDATIQECHKQEALPHYKGGRGYQPAAIYWAEQDLALVDEYRDGNVPAAMSNLPLIQRGFAELPEHVTERYFRADSACYEEPVLKWLANPQREVGRKGKIAFAISADMSKELREVCEAVPLNKWALFDDRAHETVDWAEVEFTPGNWPKDAEPLRYVALRFQKKQGQLFANGGDTMYHAVVSNRTAEDIDAPSLVRWHRQKAGTIELLHDVTKNELGAGVPPSGFFGANAAWYRLSLLAYNVLSATKSVGLPAPMSAARPKRLRFAVFNLAGSLSSHSGRLWLRLGEEAERIAGFISARQKFAALRCSYATG